MGAWIVACVLLAAFMIASAKSRHRIPDVIVGRREKTVTSRPLTFSNAYEDEDLVVETTTELYKALAPFKASKPLYDDVVVYPVKMIQPLSYNFDHTAINNQLKYEPSVTAYNINTQLKGIDSAPVSQESNPIKGTDNEGQGFSETVAYLKPLNFQESRDGHFDLGGEEGKKKHKEVHYHQHKHVHEHDHKQEHHHKHNQDHKHEHKHGHKHNAKHDHDHWAKHEHQHKNEHKHKHENKHQHHHQAHHDHEHKQEHKHGHLHHQKHEHHQDHKHEHQHKNEHHHSHHGEHHHGHKHEHEEHGKHHHHHHSENKHHHEHKHHGHHQHQHEEKHKHKHEQQAHKIYIKKYHH
ncbi:hypothetical protein NQ315_001792 [Exocentrus adspersus]|uniref:Histidine-rich glycoprotein-like n=1 Tax=Exocentrus adspersus TaxID=1586481 RepID=A0AAV8W9J0_9CUCU|nr:hypothetical protein NQ315_001792 [Exocentrus adspersus]